MATEFVILGIRHHGPGSARAVERALDELMPQAIVVEGPPEMDAVIPFVASEEMLPPVAGLVYDVKQPRQASFYPLASFSPEWVALRWALANNVPASFADLSATNRFAIEAAALEAKALEAEARAPSEPDTEKEDTTQEDTAQEGTVQDDGSPAVMSSDPIGTLAELAGYDDAERWWEDAIEQRSVGSPLDQFAAVNEAMASYRKYAEDVEGAVPADNEMREASMRKILRKLAKSTEGTIAVVCGAFHAPALQQDNWPSASADNATLKGLPKTKVAATWAPWTSQRLAYSSGYGAGVSAPGWYEHLFSCSADLVPTWMVRTASLLREENFDASPAAVVEATRLAETLAALRGRPLAGVTEVLDASTTVLGQGSEIGLSAIAHKLWVGDVLGTVPPETPMVPLAEDLAKLTKSLRLKQSAAEKVITLDLRTESHRNRSNLFRRLHLLGVPWGVEAQTGRTGGTFKEAWTIEWKPEFAVSLIEASLYGTTVSSAASAKAVSVGEESETLGGIAAIIELSILAELNDALDALLAMLDRRSAEQADHVAIMMAVEPLARSVRYGSVRELDTTALESALDAIVRRVSVGLFAACASLDDDAALLMRQAIDSVDRSIAVLDSPELVSRWRDALAELDETSGHGLVVGRVSRLLLDSGRIEADEAANRLSRALSTAAEPVQAAGWLDGFIAGDVSLLLFDDRIFEMIDEWVSAMPEAAFDDLLPVIRRSFSTFQRGERRQLGDRVVRGDKAAAVTEGDIDIDLAAPALAKAAELLGVELR